MEDHQGIVAVFSFLYGREDDVGCTLSSSIGSDESADGALSRDAAEGGVENQRLAVRLL